MINRFDYQIELGKVFNALEGINLPIEEFDLPVAVFNTLKRGGIHDLQQILAMNADELKFVLKGSNRKREVFEYIIYILDKFNTDGIPEL